MIKNSNNVVRIVHIPNRVAANSFVIMKCNVLFIIPCIHITHCSHTSNTCK